MTNRLFARIIATYLAICAIPVIMGLVAYHQAAQSAQEQTRRLTGVMLERASTSIDDMFSEIELDTMALAADRSIKRMVNSAPMTEDAAAYSAMCDAFDAISYYKMSNDDLLDIMLYSPRSGTIITSSRMFMSLDRFYGKFFQYGDMDMSTWSARVLGDASYARYLPARDTMMRTGAGNSDTVNQNAILFTRQVPSGQQRGRLIVSVSLNELEDSLSSMFDAYGGCVLIYDSLGNELAALGEVTDEIRGGAAGIVMRSDISDIMLDTQQGSKLLVSSRSQLGWRFVAALEPELVYGGIGYLRINLWVMIAVELLLIAVVAVLFARRTVRPVRGLIELVGDGADDASVAVDEFGYLRKMITLMKQEYQSASSRLNMQSRMLRRQLLASRLRGDMPESMLRDAFARAQLRYPEEQSAIALMRIETGALPDGHSAEELARLVLGEHMARIASDEAAGAWLDEERYALVYYQGGDREGLSEVILRLNAAMDEAGCPLPIISVCPPDGQHTLSQRYQRADLRINRWDAEPGAVDWIDAGMELRSIGIHYSVKVEERVIRAIKAGTPGELKAMLDKLIEQNRDIVRSDRVAVRMLTSAFRMTCARAQREAQFTPAEGEKDAVNVDPESAISSSSPLEDFYAWCMRASEQIEKQRHGASGGRSIEPVCEFLCANYADKQLSLAYVAEKFGLSETYFSRIFKAQKGESYSEYLERVRISHACELLSEGESVDATAGKVGYNSVTVFRAAFKRICGVTPSEFKAEAR